MAKSSGACRWRRPTRSCSTAASPTSRTPAVGRARFSRGCFIAAFACLWLAACQTDDNLTTGSVNQAAAHAVAFDSIDGPPPAVFKRLVAQLSSQAETRQLPVVSRTDPAAWRVRLYLAAHVEKKQAAISWVGDVYDARLNRAYRVSGEEPMGPARKDVWALADNAVLARIATNSLDAILQGAGGPAPAETTEPQTVEPQDTAPPETGTPMATLPTTGASTAFADTAR